MGIMVRKSASFSSLNGGIDAKTAFKYVNDRQDQLEICEQEYQEREEMIDQPKANYRFGRNEIIAEPLSPKYMLLFQRLQRLERI